MIEQVKSNKNELFIFIVETQPIFALRSKDSNYYPTFPNDHRTYFILTYQKR